MMDAADQAQAIDERERDALIARIAQSHLPRDASVDAECIDCGKPIEPKRLRALGATSRCAACAHRLEKRYRGAKWK
jgi:RNA polymerase-binding transcription factor DksA